MGHRWNNNDVISLINAYKKQDILWNQGNPDFKRRDLRKAAWERLVLTQLRHLRRSVATVKSKIDSLKATHRNILKRPEGTQSVDWFAWPHLQFIRDNAAQQNANNSNQSTTAVVAARVTRLRPSMVSWVPTTMPPPTNPPQRQSSRSSTSNATENETSNASTPRRATSNQTPSTADAHVLRSGNSANGPSDSQSTNQASRSRPSAQESENQTPRVQALANQSTPNSISTPSEIDEYQSFANYLATQFRKVPRGAFLSMRRRINEMIDEAEMEMA